METRNSTRATLVVHPCLLHPAPTAKTREVTGIPTLPSRCRKCLRCRFGRKQKERKGYMCHMGVFFSRALSDQVPENDSCLSWLPSFLHSQKRNSNTPNVGKHQKGRKREAFRSPFHTVCYAATEGECSTSINVPRPENKRACNPLKKYQDTSNFTLGLVFFRPTSEGTQEVATVG